jgi:gas vesicle protein
MSEKGGGRGFLLGMLVGGALGAAAGMLLSPKPDKEMREQLADQAELVRSRRFSAFDQQVSELRQNLAEVRDIVREAVAEGRDVLREAMEEGKRASARTQEELREQYREHTHPTNTEGGEAEKR